MDKITPAKVIGAAAILAAGYGIATVFHEHEKHLDHEISNAKHTLLKLTWLAALKVAECKVTLNACKDHHDADVEVSR